MAGEVTIYGPDGRALPGPQERQKLAAYQAAERRGMELADWMASRGSADADLLPEREELAAKARDMARNEGWVSGGLQKLLDTAVGAGWTLSALPDWRALGLDREWASEAARTIEALWRDYAEDPGFYCDAERQGGAGSLIGRAFRQVLEMGEAIATLVWEPDRGGTFATTLQLIDPDRLSNPYGRLDSDMLRAGVERDVYGAAEAYWFQTRHPYEYVSWQSEPIRWTRVPRELEWGRPQVIHYFDPSRARPGQTRGASHLAPALKRMRMLMRYDEAELQAALINAIYVAAVESPYDPEMVQQGLGGNEMSAYQQMRGEFHEESRLKLANGARFAHLFPGEKMNFLTASRPVSAFADFERAVLRNLATGLGLSYEQLTMDWSGTNYSSGRMALLEVWRFIAARAKLFGSGFVGPWYAAWLEEVFDRGLIDLPPGAPDFYEARTAYCRAKWRLPPRGWVDPVKEAQAAGERIKNRLSTLEDEAAEQGKDWEDVADQLAREDARLKELGLGGLPTAPDGVVARTDMEPEGA
jgi:lambda family phage portal protein